MKLINIADLTFKTDAEIRAMIAEALQSLGGMDPTGPEYDATASSIGIMRRALAARRPKVPGL